MSPLLAAGSSATPSRGSPPHSRCIAGQRPRRSTPWTACGRRMPTPPGWATRSTFPDRCLRPSPTPLSLPLWGPGWVLGACGAAQGGRGQDCPPQVVGAQAELACPSWSLCRPGTGTRSCRPHGSCLGKTCLSDCCEKEPYSRCPWPLRPDQQPQALLPPPHWFSVVKREAGSGLLWIRAFRDLPGHSATFCLPADNPSSFFWPL